jgi:succinate-semialdehyde dehydrogenase/glutarate-semialdehyde dehydrogenase
MNMSLINSTNPSQNYVLLGSVPSTSESEIVSIVENAKKIQKEWAHMATLERVAVLRKLYVDFTFQKEDIAQSIALEMGMPIKLARDEVQYGLNYYLWYLDNAASSLTPEVVFENHTEIHTVYYEPK